MLGHTLQVQGKDKQEQVLRPQMGPKIMISTLIKVSHLCMPHFEVSHLCLIIFMLPQCIAK